MYALGCVACNGRESEGGKLGSRESEPKESGKRNDSTHNLKRVRRCAVLPVGLDTSQPELSGVRADRALHTSVIVSLSSSSSSCPLPSSTPSLRFLGTKRETHFTVIYC